MSVAHLAAGRVREALLGSDPGLVRLRLAGTSTASLLVSLGVMTGLARATGEPVTVVLLGVVITMIASIAVTEPDLGAARLTTVLLPLPAAAAVCVGALLAGHRVLADLVFVTVMVVTVYVRRFGPRAGALGQVGFMSYFFVQFLGATLAQIPWLVLALVVGTACTLVIRGWLFAEHPERTLRRTVAAFRARAATVVGRAREAVATGALSEAGRRRLRLRLARLNETALLVEDELERSDAALAWPGLSSRALALQVFDAELTVERLVAVTVTLVCSGRPLAPEVRSALVEALGQLRARIGVAEVADPLANGPTADGRADGRADGAARRLGATIFEVSRAMCGRVSAEVPEVTAAGEPGDDDAGESQAWPSSSARQAIQVGVATSLAIVAGELISPSRWYWAVITAFVVFANTSSRGEILSRGWQRILGTLAGVLTGIGLAVAVGGNTVASLVMLVVCLFFGLYLMRVSQGLFVFWVTAVLALLYGLLGRFSVGVLVLRLEETAAGATIGIAVAFLVLPSSTRGTVSGYVEDFLSDLDDLLGRAVRRLLGLTSPGEEPLLARARELDETLRTLRSAARPLTAGLSGISGRAGFRRTQQTLSVCDRYARALARLAANGAVADPVPGLDPAARAVRANVRAVRARLARRDQVELTDTAELFDVVERSGTRPDAARAVWCLRRIDAAVVGLAVDLGVPRPAVPVASG